MPNKTSKRRAPGEGRRLILAAAQEVFGENGYSGATTREIADRAGVVEALLFRSFGSKAGLFNEVVFGPIQEFVDEWEVYQESIGSQYTDEVHGTTFIDRFYDLLREHRGLVMSYLAATIFDPDVLESNTDGGGLKELFSTFDRIGLRRVSGDAGNQPTKEELVQELVAVRSLVGMVMMAAMFEDLLFDLPDHKRPNTNYLKRELSNMASHIVRTYLVEPA